MPVARLFWHLVLPGSVSRVAFALYIVFDGMLSGTAWVTTRLRP